jgi:hypothetical protein
MIPYSHLVHASRKEELINLVIHLAMIIYQDNYNMLWLVLQAHLRVFCPLGTLFMPCMN